MKDIFVIADKTENTGKPYIAEDLSNIGDITTAWHFSSEEEAQAVIDSSGWDWAYVVKAF